MTKVRVRYSTSDSLVAPADLFQDLSICKKNISEKLKDLKSMAWTAIVSVQ